MPDVKSEALNLQQKFHGDPRGLAQNLVLICLTKTDVVYEVFALLNDYSRLDVGCRFVNGCDFDQLVATRKGLFLCSKLYEWLTTRVILQPTACAGNTFILFRLKSAIDTAKPEKGAEETEGNPYYTIDAGINLEDEAIAVSDKIAPLYFVKVGEKFNVNSGTRDSWHQAEAMYTVYVTKDKTLHLYRNRKAANELIEIIKKWQRTGQSKAAIVQTMAELVQGYFDKGVLMSDHQKAGAIDIAIVGDKATGVLPMDGSQRKIMMDIATKVTGFAALLESSPPHIHVKFK